MINWRLWIGRLRPDLSRVNVDTPSPTQTSTAGPTGSEIHHGQPAGRIVGSMVDWPATLSRRSATSPSWARPGAQRWRWDGPNLRMKTETRVLANDADVIDPYFGMTVHDARRAWASHQKPTIGKAPMDYLAFAKALEDLSPEHRKQAIAAMAEANKPNGKFAWMRNISSERWESVRAVLRAGADSPTPELRTALAANRILAAAARARGETLDQSETVAGPPQARVRATAEQILAAGRKARGEA